MDKTAVNKPVLQHGIAAGMQRVEAIPTILVVDDEPANLGVLNALLQPHYRVRVARSGADALRAAITEPSPDLILLDIMMPGMDGFGVLQKLRTLPACSDIPVIFVTAMSEGSDEQHGLELGAADYITKPINPATLLARVHTQIALKQARNQLHAKAEQLEHLVAERTKALKLALTTAKNEHAALKTSYFGTLMAINALADLRDNALEEHAHRVAEISRQLAADLGLNSGEVQDVFVGALLHDIGKIAFSDEILQKPVHLLHGNEITQYRRHPMLGAGALEKIESLAEVAAMVRYHHEHYDGSGFPEGISGLEIPMGARIIGAVSDYDDLRNGVLTHTPMNRKESLRYLIEGRGRRYDPQVIDRLERLLPLEPGDEIDEIQVSAGHLQEGMQLSRAVMHPDGFLLLAKSTVLVKRLITQLVTVERDVGHPLDIHVLRERVVR